MTSDDYNPIFAEAVTKAELGKIPPKYIVATGHEDEVMLFVVELGDTQRFVLFLESLIELRELMPILHTWSETCGLIRKRLPLEAALRFKDELASSRTIVELVRPIDE